MFTSLLHAGRDRKQPEQSCCTDRGGRRDWGRDHLVTGSREMNKEELYISVLQNLFGAAVQHRDGNLKCKSPRPGGSPSVRVLSSF